jgi:TonB family protein
MLRVTLLSVLVAGCTALPALVSPADAAQARATGPEPRRTKQVEPVYPPEAKARGVRGAVVLQVTIDGRGRVTDVEVVRSNPPFDEPAVNAVRQWEYDMTGVASPRVTTVTILFPPAGTRTAAAAPRAAGPAAAANGIADADASSDLYAPRVRPLQQVNAEIARLTRSITAAASGTDTGRTMLRLRGFLYATTGRLGLARRDLDLVLNANARDDQAHFAMGLASLAGNPKAAAESFSSVIRLQPNRVDGYRGRAWAYMAAGRFGDAAADFDQVLKRAPDAEARRGRAWAHLHAEQYDRALDDFAELNRIDPSHPEGSYGRGLALHFSGRRAEAQAAFRSTMRFLPSATRAMAYNTVLLDDWSRFTRVLQRLEPRAGRKDEDPDTLIAVAVTSFRQLPEARPASGRARAALDRLLKVQPGRVDGLMYRAMVNAVPLVNYRPSLAIEDLSEVIRLDPRHTEAYFRRALIRAGDKEGLAAAVDDCRRAVELSPDEPRLRAVLTHLENEHREWEQLKPLIAAQRAARAEQAERDALLIWGAIGLGLGASGSSTDGFAQALNEIGWGMMMR